MPGTAKLTDADLESLAKSWITPDIVEAAGLFRIANEQAGDYGFPRNGHGDLSGIVFPYPDPENRCIRGYRLRRDNPELEMKDGGALKPRAKYLSPVGQRNFLYFPPGTDANRLCDPSLLIVIVEGEKKCLAAHRLAWDGLSDAAERPRFLPVGIAGAWSWRGRVGKQANSNGKRVDVYNTIPDMERINWAGRKVTLWPDMNYKTNRNVAAGWDALRKELERRGAIVRVAGLS